MNDFHANLYKARACHAQADFERALVFCKGALQENSDDPQALTLLGAIENARGFYQNSHLAYQKAAHLAPYDNSIQLNFASSAKLLGHFDDAALILESIIANDPKFAPAYFTLAGIRNFSDPKDPWIEKFELLKKKTYGHTEYLSASCFALGKIYDDLGDWDRAFENFQEGNNLENKSYKFNNDLALFDTVKLQFENFQKDVDGFHSDKPVFIVGMPRCGSTLTESHLSASSEVHPVGERTEIFQAFYHSIGAEPASSHDYGQAYVGRMERFSESTARLLDKNLFNHMLIGFIKAILPESKILHVQRDPIDTCLSSFFQRFQEGNEFTFSLISLGKRFSLYTEIMKYWSVEFQLFEVSYEDLINNPDPTRQKLFKYVGLEAPDFVARGTDRAIATASAWQVRQPLYKTSVKRWKNYEKHLGPLFQSLEKHGFNYDGVG